jgi:hypothetical protein
MAADTRDTDSPEVLVEALYQVISGPASEERDWERFRSLFVDGARFLIRASSHPDESVQEGEWDVEGYVEAAREEYREQGFWEREVWCQIERYGNIAQVFSTYETRVGSPDSAPVLRGINSVQCIRTGHGWRIAHVIFDMESEANPIPAKYLPD